MATNYKYILTNDIKCPSNLDNRTFIKEGMCNSFKIGSKPTNPIECLYKTDIFYENKCYRKCINGYNPDNTSKMCIKQ